MLKEILAFVGFKSVSQPSPVILSLADQIKEQVAESRTLNKKIQAAHGLDRHYLRCEKKNIGDCTRNLLLTQAFLRNKPRSYQENSKQKLYAFHFLNLISRYTDQEFTKEWVQAWLDGEVTNESVK